EVREDNTPIWAPTGTSTVSYVIASASSRYVSNSPWATTKPGGRGGASCSGAAVAGKAIAVSAAVATAAIQVRRISPTVAESPYGRTPSHPDNSFVSTVRWGGNETEIDLRPAHEPHDPGHRYGDAVSNARAGEQGSRRVDRTWLVAG